MGEAAELNRDSVLVQAVGIHSAEIDGEAVLVDLLHDRSYRLNDDGTRLWRALDGVSTLGAISSHIARERGIREEDCYDEAREYLHDLLDRGLVARASGESWTTQEED